MDKERGLIAGIDLSGTRIQASVYSHNSGSVQSVKLTEDSHEKTNLINVIAECMRATGESQIKSICVTIADYNGDEIAAVMADLEKCGAVKGHWQILSRVESFAYYAYKQKSELHSMGVVLMDYTQEGLKCDHLAIRKSDNTSYLLQEHTGYTSDVLKEVYGSKNIDGAENELCTFAEDYFARRRVSAAYLTGEGFDIEKLPERFAKLMVTRRKAFVGQNLFARGACFAAIDMLRPEIFRNVVVLLDNHVKCGIEIDISSYGKPMRFRMVRPGVNWTLAGRTIECILEDIRSITFKVITTDNTSYDEVVDISEIPFREGRTTRISIHVEFMDADRCNITIKDLGFGEFVKSSGKVIHIIEKRLFRLIACRQENFAAAVGCAKLIHGRSFINCHFCFTVSFDVGSVNSLRSVSSAEDKVYGAAWFGICSDSFDDSGKLIFVDLQFFDL